MVSTVWLERVGLAFSGIVALVGWPFGWLPAPGLVAVLTGMAAVGPAADLYRAGRPPRGLAVATALLALTTVTLLVAAATNWALPTLADPPDPPDPDVGLLVGCLVAAPVAVAVLARSLKRADTG